MPRASFGSPRGLQPSSIARLHALRSSCLAQQPVLTPKTSTSNAIGSRFTSPYHGQRRSFASDTPPAAPQTHYDFFPVTLPRGPPPNGPFAIDLRALRNEFLKQQAAAHPDRHPSGDAKRRAEALSSRINEAYKILTDPLSRAQYVLGLQGIDVAEDETAKVEDQELLMEVLEAREVIEGAGSEDEVKTLQAQNEERLQATIKAIEGYLESADLDSAKTESVRLRYWVNIKEACVNWEQGKPITLQH